VNEAAITTSNNTNTLTINLPTPVHPSQTVYLRNADSHFEGKITALPIPTSPRTLVPSQPLSASDLRNLQPKNLCCTGCEREVADVLQASACADGGFRDLPSEYWAEMMEVWMCHSDPGWTAKIAQKSKDGFWPEQGRVLVGGSYLLINPQDVKSENIAVGQLSDVSLPNVSNSPAFAILLPMTSLA